MFHLTCFLDDKHVTQVLRALANIAKDVQMVPVAEANVVDGKLLPQAGDNVERFVTEWKRRKLQAVTAHEGREIAKAIGLSPTSYGYMLRQAIHAGLAIKTGNVAGSNRAVYALKEKGKAK